VVHAAYVEIALAYGQTEEQVLPPGDFSSIISNPCLRHALRRKQPSQAILQFFFLILILLCLSPSDFQPVIAQGVMLIFTLDTEAAASHFPYNIVNQL